LISVFFNKSNKAMPYISAPYREKSLLNNIRSSILQVPIADTGGRQIDLAPWPQYINEKGIVQFKDNGRPVAEVMRNKVVKPDVLIFATGYKQEFPFLDSSYITPGEANIRNIWKSGDESVGFIGFVRPSFGTSTFSSTI
jgi:dimethylaniline monooxygenase (N-oxide forming)